MPDKEKPDKEMTEDDIQIVEDYYVFSIDPGLTGALALLQVTGGQVSDIFTLKMPIRKERWSQDGKHNSLVNDTIITEWMINKIGLDNIVNIYNDSDDKKDDIYIIGVQEAPVVIPGQGSTSNKTSTINWGILYMFMTNCTNFYRIPSPQKWRKELNLPVFKPADKSAKAKAENRKLIKQSNINYAKKIVSDLSLYTKEEIDNIIIAGDGQADAVLIGYSQFLFYEDLKKSIIKDKGDKNAK